MKNLLFHLISLKFKNGLEEKNIPSELLFETLEFKKGTEKWHDYIENILAQNKIGIVVKEEDGRLAEEINRELNSEAIILSPRKKYVLKGKKGLRDWSSLIEVWPQLLSSETIENLTDLMMRGLYFATSVKEKEQFLAQAPYSKVFYLDGYTYNIYSQRKFYFTDTSYMIGKGAIDIYIKFHPEINYNKTKDHIFELKRRVTNLGKDRAATTIVGTAVFLANKKTSKEQSSKIIERFGKCNRTSITNLCELLKIRKNIIEEIENSLEILQKISKEYPEIDFERTEIKIREIKEKLQQIGTDRSTTTVVGIAIYLANKGLTQTKTNEIMRKFGNQKQINLTRCSKFLQIYK